MEEHEAVVDRHPGLVLLEQGAQVADERRQAGAGGDHHHGALGRGAQGEFTDRLQEAEGRAELLREQGRRQLAVLDQGDVEFDVGVERAAGDRVGAHDEAVVLGVETERGVLAGLVPPARAAVGPQLEHAKAAAGEQLLMDERRGLHLRLERFGHRSPLAWAHH